MHAVLKWKKNVTVFVIFTAPLRRRNRIILLLLYTEGDVSLLHTTSRQLEIEFYNYFRMSIPAFDTPNDILKEPVSHIGPIMRKSIDYRVTDCGVIKNTYLIALHGSFIC